MRKHRRTSVLLNSGEETTLAVFSAAAARTGDLVFFGAGPSQLNDSMGQLREKIGQDLNLLEGEWCCFWVTHFPMFEKTTISQGQGCKVFITHSQSKDHELPEMALRSYDMVINGYEVGGGLFIHQYDEQIE